MYKILTVAIREYRAMVATRAFLVSLVMMPVLMMGSLAAIEMLKNTGKVEERKILVLDPEGSYFDGLKKAADAQNELVRSRHKAKTEGTGSPSVPPGEGNGGEPDRDELPHVSQGELYLLEKWTPQPGEEVTDELLADLSQQIRDGVWYAVVHIFRERDASGVAPASIHFFSQGSSLASARSWFAGVISEMALDRRLAVASLSPVVVKQAIQPVPVRGMGLLERDSSGKVSPAREKNQMTEILLPFGVMMFMFMVIFMSSQPMLESVLEEKSQRIAEVLLGSVSPFQLMLGKLAGCVGGSLTVFCIYLAGAFVVAQRVPWLAELPMATLPWFIAFQVLGVLFYAAIFMSVGACVSQLKEAQSMLMPVWMLMMSPMFVWLLILESPNGGLARGMSLFPPSTPTAMVIRLATGVKIPGWELIAGLVGLLVATLLIVFLAGRIFRAGILWQGKTPRLAEIFRWALSG